LRSQYMRNLRWRLEIRNQHTYADWQHSVSPLKCPSIQLEVMQKMYSYYGLSDFVICLGHKGYMIKAFFSDYIPAPGRHHLRRR
jgi:hypothetical protein